GGDPISSAGTGLRTGGCLPVPRGSAMIRAQTKGSPMRNALLASATLFALSACLSGSDDSGPDPLPPGSSFAVLAIEGEAAPDGTTFELGPDDAIAGQAPCNRFMARLSRTDAGISISPGAS